MLFILGKYWATLYRGLTVEPRLSPSTFVYFVKIVELQHVASRDDVGTVPRQRPICKEDIYWIRDKPNGYFIIRKPLHYHLNVITSQSSAEAGS